MNTTTRTILLVATPFVSLAGTLCLTTPAWARGGEHQNMRQMRLNNPDLSNRQLRHMMRNDSQRGAGRSMQFSRGSSPVLQQVERPARHAMQINDLAQRINRFNGQSTFLTEQGRARAASNGLELDLTSSDRAIVLGDRVFSKADSYTINVGGQERTLTSGSQVTAAEYVALQQVVSGDPQSLTVDQSGAGVGGQFNLNSISDGGKTINASELVIPTNVTVSGDFARHADGVRVANDFVNFGSVNAYSSNSKNDTARIAARDINNESGATISSEINLALHAERDINNAGVITAGGDLELSALSINNRGSVGSTAGNVTLTGNSSESNLAVNNAGGTISALNGDINIRTADYNGAGNTTVFGGDLFSRQVNLFTGLGTTDVVVNQLTGVVNSSGTAAHISTNTDTLTLGSQCLLGDPTWYNTGNIILAGSVIAGEKIAIIAGGNITTSNTVLNIVARDASGQGFDINIIAGANVTAGSGEITPAGGPATLPGQVLGSPTQNTTSDVSFTGASTTGGNIDFTFASATCLIDSNSSTGNLSGGNITFAAFAGSGGGRVLMPAGSGFNASGDGSGNNGSVTIVAGGSNATTISVGGIGNNIGTGTSGDINIVTAQPVVSDGGTITFDTTGTITTMNQIVAGPDLSPGASINIGNILSASNNVNVSAGGEVVVSSFVFANGQSQFANGGNVNISAAAGGIFVGGEITTFGGFDASAGDVTINASSLGSNIFLNGIVAQGGTLSGNGGNIVISNSTTSGLGDILLNGNYLSSASLVDPSGTAGNISISTDDTITFNNAVVVRANSPALGTNGIVQISSGIILGGADIESTKANGGNPNGVSVQTDTGGILSNGEDVRIVTEGVLSLALSNNTINADGQNAADPGGSIVLKGSQITTNTSALNPLVLSANGGSSGNGGSIEFKDPSLTPIFIGAPAKSPKGVANFLVLSAAAGATAGDGGSVDISTGANMFVDAASLNVQGSFGGVSAGGDISLEAGTNILAKNGGLVINGNLNASGVLGGDAGSIDLDMRFKKNFVIGATKLPKNGIFGALLCNNAFGDVSVTNNGGGVQLAASNSLQCDNQVFLGASAKGSVLTSKNVVLTAPNIDLQSENEDVTVTVNANDVRVLDAPDSATVTNTNTALSNLVLALAGELTFNASGNLNISNVTTTNGDAIITTTNNGLFTVAGTAINATNGKITLLASNLNNGRVSVVNSTVATQGPKGGNVILANGVVPKKPINPAPPFDPGPAFNITNIGTGQTFFGANPNDVSGIGVSNITSLNKNVIFNNASGNPAANPIQVNNATITADPPSRVGGATTSAIVATSPRIDEQLSQTFATGTISIDTAFGADVSTLTSSIVTSTNPSLTTSSGIPSDSLLLASGNLAPVSISSLYADFGFTSQVPDGNINAFVWSDEDLGLSETTMIERNENVSPGNANSVDFANLKKGAILFAPSKDTQIATEFGTLSIAKDAVAFIMVDRDRVAVYDLHDSKKASVSIKTETHTTHLSPGQCAVLTKNAHQQFEQSNPLPTVGYRSISSQFHQNGIKMFKGEFSTLSAINSLHPLRAVLASKHQNAKRMMERLLKTSAVLMHIGANRNEFRIYAEPSITAMR